MEIGKVTKILTNNNHFLTFLNTDRNAPKEKFRIEIWTFSFQICFKNKFLTSGSGKTENTQICVITGLG